MVRRIVVTGMGTLCPLGIGHDQIWPKLVAGESGIRPIERIEVGDFPCKLAGEIPDFVAKDYVPHRKSLKVMARDIQLAVAAARMAAEDAGIDDSCDPTRIGCSMGAGLISSDVNELGPSLSLSMNEEGQFDLSKWGKEVMSNLFPLWLLKYLPNMLACHISIFRNAQGPNNTITTGDTAGIHAIGEGYHIVQRGSADAFLVGGADCRLKPMCLLQFELLGQLTHRNEDGPNAVKPFDADRDGFVPSEGGATLVVEELHHARTRNAHIYAEIVGYGCAHQAVRPTLLEPSPRGIALAMRGALADARVSRRDVSFVCAHGTGSRKGDAAEAQAIREVFGDYDVPVTAPKSMIGQTCAAGGALDAVFCALALGSDVVPPTPSYKKPDDLCPVNVISTPGRGKTLDYSLLNGVSTGGQCASLVLAKWKG